MIGQDGIRATGLYLLDVLKAEKTVLYSRFYNRTPGTSEALAKGAMSFVAEDDKDFLQEDELLEEGHVMLDFAAWQLEDLGIVQISFLDSELIDGQPDFQIALTEQGQQAVSHGLAFNFHGPDYAIDGSDASTWLTALAEDADCDPWTLRLAMEYAFTDDVTVTDDCHNTYLLGTATFAWAFEVALWHHAKCGVIIPAFRSEDDEKIWASFVASKGRPERPSLSEPHPIWDIPIRLANLTAEEKRKIDHVGQISTY